VVIAGVNLRDESSAHRELFVANPDFSFATEKVK
jgi:hypothetical protein